RRAAARAAARAARGICLAACSCRGAAVLTFRAGGRYFPALSSRAQAAGEPACPGSRARLICSRAARCPPRGRLKTDSAGERDVQRPWLLVDAEGKALGRLASQVAMALRGKLKPIYTPHLDTGDFVVVINAEKVRLSGTKPEKKTYFRHTMYPGGATWTRL